MARLRPVLLGIHFAAISAFAEPIDIVGPEHRGAVQPQVALDAAGMAHVVFGRGQAVYHTKADGKGGFRAPVKIAEIEKLALGMHRGPRVACTGEGIVVTAISHKTGTLHQWRSTDDGRSWVESEALNSVANSAGEGLHAMVSDRRSMIAVTWLDLRSGKMELWGRVSKNGGAAWDPEVRIYASPEGGICECCHPSVAIGPRGEIAAMWRNQLGGARDLWIAISRDGGRTFPNPAKLGRGSWTLKNCPMDGGGVVFTSAGPETTWRRENAVFGAQPGAAEVLVANDSRNSAIAAVGERVLVAFERGGEVYLKSGDGEPRSLGPGQAPALDANAAGAAVVWESPKRGTIVFESIR